MLTYDNLQLIGFQGIILGKIVKPGIRIVAEGHQDLYRKLHDVMKTEQEKEMMQIRMLHLEKEFRELRKKMEITA